MWVQIIYTVVTLMAFAVILLTVHIRIGALEDQVRALQRHRSSLWSPLDHARENDHD